jgi:FkbM family methyltransferase
LGKAKVLNGAFNMALRKKDDIVSNFIRYYGYWELHEPHDMAGKSGHMIPAGGTLLDIGANMGYYTLLFASRGYKVIAVEPMTHNRIALETSLCMNPELKHLVTVVPAALVAPEQVHTTRCVIRAPDYDIHVHKYMKNVGNGVLSCGNATEVKLCAKDEDNCEEPPVKSLDMVLAELAPATVDVVKMDVEDFECHVLDGGQSLFTKYQPGLLQIETENPTVQACVKDQAARHGYGMWDGTRGNRNSIMVKPLRSERHWSL